MSKFGGKKLCKRITWMWKATWWRRWVSRRCYWLWKNWGRKWLRKRRRKKEMKHGMMGFKRREKGAVSEASVVKAFLWKKDGECFHAFCFLESLLVPLSPPSYKHALSKLFSALWLVGNVVVQMLLGFQISWNDTFHMHLATRISTNSRST